MTCFNLTVAHLSRKFSQFLIFKSRFWCFFFFFCRTEKNSRWHLLNREIFYKEILQKCLKLIFATSPLGFYRRQWSRGRGKIADRANNLLSSLNLHVYRLFLIYQLFDCLFCLLDTFWCDLLIWRLIWERFECNFERISLRA